MAKVEKKPLSQKEKVLKYLEGHKKGLTKEVALEKLEIARLTSVISALKKSGVAIVAEKVTPKKGEPYTVYKLEENE